MKCRVCIVENLENVVVQGDIEPVQLAVEGARIAVTVQNGEALCTKHLHEEMFNRLQREINAAVLATKGGK